jgi:SAM-dependent methyltransferase
MNQISGFNFCDSSLGCAHVFLLPAVLNILKKIDTKKLRIFDLGCGNGSVANALSKLGYEVIGVDPSVDGIQRAKKSFPHIKLEYGSSYDNLKKKYGQFPVLISLEVIEHVYAPRKHIHCIYSLLQPGGIGIISTPYHSYLKNLFLSLAGKMDDHFTALWDDGHIKFWSIKTLTKLLKESGFKDIHFLRVGRIPILAKSMIAIIRKPLI